MTDIRNQIGDRRVTVESEDAHAEEDVDELVRSHVLREALIGTCLGCDRVVRGTRSDVTVLGLGFWRFRSDVCSIVLTHHNKDCVRASLMRALTGGALPGYEEMISRLIADAWASTELVHVLVRIAFKGGEPDPSFPYLHQELPGRFVEGDDE